MSNTPGVNNAGTKDEFNLDDVNFDAVEESNAAKIDAQEVIEPSNECEGGCII